MPLGKRKFFVELTDTENLTVDELTKALSRLAGHISNGRAPLESGIVRDSGGAFIGTYGWRTQLVVPKSSES
jgi:hypothetical protein